MTETASQHTGKGPVDLDFKSAALYTLRVVLRNNQLDKLQAALDKRMAEAGSLFQNEAVVLDASEIDAQCKLDWPALIAMLEGHHLHPIGVVAHPEHLEAARAAGLVAVDLSSAPVRPAAVAAADHEVPAVAAPVSNPSPAPAAPPAESTLAPAAMVVNRQLRSGQRVYARNTDLIVIGVVGQGAEVIADGNIHVYGPLRGKAMAGARGDTSACIYTTALDPELVAIAGVYRVIETRLDDDLHNQAAVVQLDGDSLQITALKDKR